MSNKEKKILGDIDKALKIFPKVVKAKEKAYREKQKILKNFAPLSRKLLQLTENAVPPKAEKKVHPWRLCPFGQHWVKSHPLHVPISEKNPSGITTRDGHCRTNSSRRDQIYYDEIEKIASEHFENLKAMPTPNRLGADNGNNFDRVIAGWTQYWNEVLQPNVPLEPNLVKALISTESDFQETVKVLASKGNWARGLMQVTDQTLKILANEKGELKDYLINIDQKDAFDPNANICAGVRWLFHKKSLLEHRLKRSVPWEEAAMEYKSYTRYLKRGDPNAKEQRDKFLERLGTLRNI